MQQEIFKKDKYDEQLIRRALYWLSAHCEWTLDEDENSWLVHYDGDTELRTVLHRLVNDQILRQKIDRSTANLRERIIRKVFKELSDD
jgi:His-Xaa-Ser system protein HxsD